MRYLFHDAGVTSVTRNGADLLIVVEGATAYGDDDRELGLQDGTVVVTRIRSMLEDGALVDCPTMPFDDGTIFEMSLTELSLDMIVEWCQYQSKTSRISHYIIHGDAVLWMPTGQMSPRT